MPNGYLNAFRGPDEASIDRSAYTNRLMRNDVERIPQRNAAEDMAIQADQQTLSQNKQLNARKFLAESLGAIPQSQNPLELGRSVIANPNVQSALRDVGVDPAQFTIDQTDTPEGIARQAADWARVFGAQNDQPTPTDDMREYDRALSQGFKGTFVDYQTQMRRAGATSIDMTQRTPPPPQGMVYMPDSDPNNRLGYRLEPIPGSRDPRTEAQQKAGLLSARMRELSADVVDTAPTITTQMISRIAQSGGVAGGLANEALDPQQQKHFNAARGWLAGVLRQDTGATIQPFEIAEYYPTFFPVPGDSPQVIEQKRKLRAVTENAITANSGQQQPQQAQPQATDINALLDKYAPAAR